MSKSAPGMAVAINSLRWRRAKSFALDLPSIAIVEGSRIALIGGNGSGKSSLIELLAGLALPDQGEVRVLGRGAHDPMLRREVGVQIAISAYNPVLTVGDYLRLHRSLHKRIDPSVDSVLDVYALAGHRVSELSQGQRRRLDLHLALAHFPRLILLDEPTAGLDGARAVGVLEFCRTAATHDADELADADRALWLDEGQIRADGTPTALMNQALGAFNARLEFADDQTAIAAAQALTRAVQSTVTQVGTVVCVTADHDLRAVCSSVTGQLEPVAAAYRPATLNQFLQDITRRQRTAQGGSS
jgi:ABC-type multidrug transport system ATPase subunit